MELGSHSELDYLLLQVSTAGLSDFFCLCDSSTQPLKEQVTEYASCFALVGSPPP